MFKNLIRTIIALIIIVIFFVSYLSIFGIKTSKFNEIIKAQITKQDKRLNVDLKDVFIKLNIKERSFYLNSKDVKLFIHKQSQEIDNVDLLISLRSYPIKLPSLSMLLIIISPAPLANAFMLNSIGFCNKFM